MRKFIVEMKEGFSPRMVGAHAFSSDDGWVIFYIKPPEGGIAEHLRVRQDAIISIETARTEQEIRV